MSPSGGQLSSNVVWAYSRDLRERLVAYVRAGHSRREAAEVFTLSYDSAKKWVQWADKGRSLEANKPPGPEPKLTTAEQEQLAEWVREKPDRTLKEYRQLIQDHFGKALCLSAVDVNLRKLGFTHKKSLGTPPSRTVSMSRPSASNGVDVKKLSAVD
jgi:transposase